MGASPAILEVPRPRPMTWGGPEGAEVSGLERSRGHPQDLRQLSRHHRQHEMRETLPSGQMLGFLPQHRLGGGPGGTRAPGRAARITHPWKFWRQTIVFAYY